MHNIVIAGKPNTGKSSLFNALTGRPFAIVASYAGVTRDTVSKKITVDDFSFLLTDSGGIGETDDELHEDTLDRALRALKEADFVIFMLDIHNVTGEDRAVFKNISILKKPYLVCVNKADKLSNHSSSTAETAYDMSGIYQLGIKQFLNISCKTGFNIQTLKDTLKKTLQSTKSITDETESKKPDFSCAIIGKPNAGKSSLMNRIFQNDRAIVSEIPGTTRDTIADYITYKNKKIRFLDTAGLRRKTQKKKKLEYMSGGKSISAVKSCDIAVLLVDASCDDAISEQDKKIAGIALNNGKALFILVNKWDLVQKEQSWHKYEERLRYLFAHIAHVPVINISCKTGFHIRETLNKLLWIWEEYNKSFRTGNLNQIIQKAINQFPPRRYGRSPLKIYYTVQTRSAPPQITAFVNNPKKVNPDYKKYLLNQIRKEAGANGVPLEMIFKARDEKQKTN